MVVAWSIETVVWLYEGYQWTLTFADPRVEKWLFMDSPLWTFYLTVAYLCMVIVGPIIMDFFPALQLRGLLVVYNAGLTLLNAYIFLELLVTSYQANYSYQCQPVVFSNDPLELRIAAVLWWFYFSKFLEFADTLFFIVRKKYNQLTFLHVYHHVTMFGFWWIGIKWVAGGSSFLGALMNSFVHTIMYFYYGYTAAFPRANVWWKKHLTTLQLIQFVIAIVQTAIGLYIDCPFPRWMGWTLIGYMMSFIVLFGNFWIHAYAKKSAAKKQEKGPLTEEEINRRKRIIAIALKDQSMKEKLAANGFYDKPNQPKPVLSEKDVSAKAEKSVRRRSKRLKTNSDEITTDDSSD